MSCVYRSFYVFFYLTCPFSIDRNRPLFYNILKWYSIEFV